MQMRALARYGLVLVGGFLAAPLLVDAVNAWREWHGLSVADPSAADLYRTNFWIDVVGMALILGVAGLSYWLLRPRSDAADPGLRE